MVIYYSVMKGAIFISEGLSLGEGWTLISCCVFSFFTKLVKTLLCGFRLGIGVARGEDIGLLGRWKPWTSLLHISS